MKIEQGYYFPTPIWTVEVPDHEPLDTGLIAFVERLRAQDPGGVQKSNLMGWQSRSDLHRDPAFAPLAALVLGVADAITPQFEVFPDAVLDIQNAWANANPYGASNAPHVHAGSALSGSYYARTPENCGDIEFLDPRGAAVTARPVYPQERPNVLTNSRFTLRARAGLLVLFPGWLQHYVHPNRSQEDRISFAFNLGFVHRNQRAEPDGA